MNVTPPPNKLATIEKLLEDQYAIIHLNPNFPGVEIPQFLKESSNVSLKISYFFKGPLKVTPEKITAELLFQTTFHVCEIPLMAIWGATAINGQNFVWPESLSDNHVRELKEKISLHEKEIEELKEPLPKKSRVSKKSLTSAEPTTPKLKSTPSIIINQTPPPLPNGPKKPRPKLKRIK